MLLLQFMHEFVTFFLPDILSFLWRLHQTSNLSYIWCLPKTRSLRVVVTFQRRFRRDIRCKGTVIDFLRHTVGYVYTGRHHSVTWTLVNRCRLFDVQMLLWHRAPSFPAVVYLYARAMPTAECQLWMDIQDIVGPATYWPRQIRRFFGLPVSATGIGYGLQLLSGSTA